MLEKMREARDGHVRLALPSAIVLVVACVMGLVFYPMAHMEMRDLPFAVLSLDEGAQTPAGQMNAGNMLVENVTSAAAGGDAEEGGATGWTAKLQRRPSRGRRWRPKGSWTRRWRTTNSMAPS